ncbi:MAG: hypothetical protein LBC79_06565 [Deltaproteobacteria bacterium]|jgi:SSS family solute:Na+ symporter|nr:hypothetical protein [Deltaproteobacteria bacterium]
MGVAVFVVYAAVMLAVAGSFGNREINARSFFLNSRSSSAALVACSLVASCVGASATIGMVGLAFTVGTPAFWWLGSGAIGLSILTVLLARRVRSSGACTLPEMLDAHLGSQVRRLTSAIIVVAWTAILAAQFVALTQILAALTGLSPRISLMLGVLLIVTHTLVSGQSGVMRLDRLQCCIMAAGLLLAAVWLAQLNPGVLKTISIETTNARFPLHRLLYFLTVLGGSYVVCPMLFGRLLSAESAAAARTGSLWAAVALCGASALIVLIGLLSQGLIPGDTPPDRVLTGVVATAMPAWASYVIYLTLASAVVSSADSCLLTASLILAGDLLQRKGLRCARCCIIGLALAGLLLTFMDKGILDFLLMANDVYVCGVVPPVLCALMWSETRKPRRGIFMAGILCGGALGLLSSMTGASSFSYLGIAASAALAVVSFRSAQARPAAHG